MKKNTCSDCGGPCDHRVLLCRKCAFKGERNPCFGRVQSIEQRQKQSDFMKEKLADKTKHPLYGKKMSEKTKEALKQANENRIPWNKGLKKVIIAKPKLKKGFKIGHPYHPRPNYVISDETKIRMSLGKKGMPNWKKGLTAQDHPGILAGEKHGMWLGGVSFEPYTADFNRNFKNFIRERDNYSCAVCNVFSESLPVHHIDYDKTNSIPQNCLCLCRSCHSKTNINRAHWKVFFQNVLKERFNYEYENNLPVIDLRLNK